MMKNTLDERRYGQKYVAEQEHGFFGEPSKARVLDAVLEAFFPSEEDRKNLLEAIDILHVEE